MSAKHRRPVLNEGMFAQAEALGNLVEPACGVLRAGPDVFHPDAVARGRQRVAMCVRYGFVGLNPGDLAPQSWTIRADRSSGRRRAGLTAG